MKRRDFLYRMGLGAGAAALSPLLFSRRAGAAPNTTDYVIFCEMQGAWDLQLCLDTRDPAVFTPQRVPETGIELAWDLLPARFRNTVTPNGSNITFGPAMATFANRHYDKCCVVRGINMETLSHVVGQRYFITGKKPAGEQARGSSIAATMAEQALPLYTGPVPEVPNLVVDTEAFFEGELSTARPWRMGGRSVYELFFAFRDGIGDPLPDLALASTRPVLDPYRANYTACDPAGLDRGGMLQRILGTQLRARAIVQADLSQHFDFNSPVSQEMIDLRTNFGFAQLGTPGAQAAIAYQAIRYGISQFVTIRLQDDLDTHNDRWWREQPILLEDAFDALDALVTQLGATPHPDIPADSLLDHTTIVVHSDFSRTPTLNSLQGRDHSLLNAALLIGNRVPHNLVVGGSSDIGMSPLNVDPMTGAPVMTGGSVIKPEHVLGAVMYNLGYDPADLRVTGRELPVLNV